MEGLSFYVETFGCQMNEQDSLRICDRLVRAGCRQVPRPGDADILVVNTCAIRKKAEQKAYSLLGRWRRLKSRKPGITLAVGGCVAQQKGERLLEIMPQVDLVFGPRQVWEVDRLLSECRSSGRRVAELSWGTSTPEELECPGLPAPGGLKAYITVMEGCDNSCSYCIVPSVRGPERSRPFRSILEEAVRLLEGGVKELTLLGQNVNAYRAPDRAAFGFADLLARLGSLQGLRRLRFTTSHPKDLSDDLIQCFGSLPPLCEHIHLPIQSGSDAVLAAMNRGYTYSEYLEKVHALRDRVPEIAITSDVIVGYPGEGIEEFEETLRAIRTLRYDGLFSFKFSPRPGTLASRLPETVPEEEKRRRLRLVQELQGRITLEKNRALEGRTVEVLVEGRSKEGVQWMGRTRTNRVVNFTGPERLVGRLVGVWIQKGCPHSLRGVVVVEPEQGTRRPEGGRAGDVA